MQLHTALKEWSDFYVLVGTASATLLALLFVAVSLGAGFLSEEQKAATRTFMSPVVIHFTSVFFISAISLAPLHAAFFIGLFAATAVIGGAVSIVITVQVVRTDLTRYWEDYFAYGLLPLFGYLILLATAVMIGLQMAVSLDLLAAALLLLIIVNIRNVWDLTLTMVRRHTGALSHKE